MSVKRLKKPVIHSIPTYSTPELLVREEFKKQFNSSIYDHGSMRRFEKSSVWTFDIIAFEKYLESKSRQSYSRSKSQLRLLNGVTVKCTTREFVIRNHGLEGDRLVRYLILGDWDKDYKTHR